MSPTLQVDAIFVKDETVATKVPVVNNLKAKVPCATNHFQDMPALRFSNFEIEELRICFDVDEIVLYYNVRRSNYKLWLSF